MKHSGDVRVLVGGKTGTPEKMETDDQLSDNEYTTPKDEEMFSCVHCQYTGDSVTDIENHIITHLTKQENELKCCFCPYIASQKYELYDHLKMHGVSEPEDYFNKTLPDTQLSENSLIYIQKYKCQFCPFICESKHRFISHKHFHKPGKAVYRCKYCTFNVPTANLLQQHMQLHIDNNQQIKPDDFQQTFLDTQSLKDVPLVWVSKDNKFSKMYKCRFCPHLNARKVNIQEHEKMHGEHEESIQSTKDVEVSYSCPDCSYVCNNAGVLSAHFKTHQGVHGQIHCIVDPNRTDEEQITELTNLLQKNYSNSDFITVEEGMEIENDCDTEKLNASIEITQIEPEKLLFFCQHCPARYLYEKELETHIRFHGSRLFYKCDFCSYTGRQRPHLLAHYGVHSQEYNQETKLLQREYQISKEHPPPSIGVIEASNMNNELVCVVTLEGSNQLPVKPETTKLTNKKYACPKCPTKFYNGELLSYHLTLHGGKHPYRCHMCDYSAITRNNLEKHERIHGKVFDKKEPSIQISIGDVPIMPGTKLYQQILDAKKHNEKFVFKNDQILNDLNKNKCYSSLQFKTKGTKDKKYKCSKCPCTFEKKEQFKIHLSLHGSKQRYQCDRCDYSVKYYANYIQHIRKHDLGLDIKSLDDDIKEITIEDDVIDVDDCKSPRVAVKTLQANKPGALKLSLADRQTLMILQEIRNNNIPKEVLVEEKKLFWCPHCPYTSYRKDAVDNHVNRHMCVSGIRNNYICDHCDYTVPQSHFLREHTKIHFSAFKYHQPEGYLVGSNMKLSSEKLCEDNEEQNENVLFEDCGSVNGEEQYQPKVDNLELINNNNDDVKIFINPNTLEIVDNSLQENNETKEDEKS